ncbi:MAG: putative glutathione S-transferase [Phenylobacterium sp.]|nr:putative glutathione S-transferase [Phenylobacterium sp.]
MSTLTIHGIPGSPYVRMPLMACEEKGAPWRLAALQMGGSRTPEHLARQPFARMPAMEHGDFQLYESQAIIRYIDQVFDGPALTPAAPRAVARMNQVMGIVDCYVSKSISGGISWNRLVAPIFGMPVDEEAIVAAIPMARTCVAALEDILGDNAYFAGDAVSLADIMAFPNLEMLPLSPEGAEVVAGSPLLDWLARMAQRPSVAATAWERLSAMTQAEPA